MNPKWKLWGITAVIILLISGTWFVSFRQKTIIVTINGESQPLTTTALNVRGALKDLNIIPQENDIVTPDAKTWISDLDRIEFIHASTVIIKANDDIQVFTTSKREVQEIIKNSNFDLSSQDVILVNGKATMGTEVLPYDQLYQIEIRRPVKMILESQSKKLSLNGTSISFGSLLWEEDLPLYEGDKLSVAPTSVTTNNLAADLTPAQPLKIQVGDQTISTRSLAQSTGEILASAGEPLQYLDYSKPGARKNPPEEGNIQLVNVEEEVVLEQALINFSSQLQAVPDLEIDNLVTLQTGEYGLEAQRIRIRYEDGEEISRSLEDNWVAREPVPRIEGYGTKIVIRTLQTPNGTIEYWRAVQFYATSYSPSRSGTSPDKPWYGHVYCGGLLQTGFVGVDLDYVPCGTKLYIPGYGFAVAMDTGNITGAWIDLGFLDNEYVQWNQYVTVYFLTPIPPLDQIQWIIPPGSFY